MSIASYAVLKRVTLQLDIRLGQFPKGRDHRLAECSFISALKDRHDFACPGWSEDQYASSSKSMWLYRQGGSVKKRDYRSASAERRCSLDC